MEIPARDSQRKRCAWLYNKPKEEFGGRGTPNAEAMKTVFTAAGEMPTAVMKHLVW